MAKYSEGFKLESVGKLELLLEKKKKKEKLILDGVQINNVRELVNFLGISSFSLYKWYKEIQYLGRNIDLEIVKEELEAMEDLEVLGFEGEGDFFDEHDYPPETYKKKPYEDGIFTGRFYAWLAGGLNIPYASRNAIDTNLLKIGLELIKRSGLIDCDKIKKAMRLN